MKIQQKQKNVTQPDVMNHIHRSRTYAILISTKRTTLKNYKYVTSNISISHQSSKKSLIDWSFWVLLLAQKDHLLLTSAESAIATNRSRPPKLDTLSLLSPTFQSCRTDSEEINFSIAQKSCGAWSESIGSCGHCHRTESIGSCGHCHRT